MTLTSDGKLCGMHAVIRAHAQFFFQDAYGSQSTSDLDSAMLELPEAMELKQQQQSLLTEPKAAQIAILEKEVQQIKGTVSCMLSI